MRRYTVRVTWLHQGNKYERNLTQRVVASNAGRAADLALREAKKAAKKGPVPSRITEFEDGKIWFDITIGSKITRTEGD